MARFVRVCLLIVGPLVPVLAAGQSEPPISRESTSQQENLSFAPGDSMTSPGTERIESEMVLVSDFGFNIDKYEVTNAQYAEFLNEKGNQNKRGITWTAIDSKDALIELRDGRFVAKPGYENHPVIQVSWYGAKAYCEWVDKRLPTEEEWQQACQGPDGRMYPWGDSEPAGNLANL